MCTTKRKFACKNESALQGNIVNIVEPGYNDIGLYDTSPRAPDIPWYQLIPHC